MAQYRRLSVSDVNDVAVVRFVDHKILDESVIQELGQELFQLVEADNRKRLLAQFPTGRVSFERSVGKADYAR